MTTLVNVTRRTVTIYDRTGTKVLIELPTETPPAVADARAEQVDVLRDQGMEIPVVRHVFDHPRDIPDPEDGVVYVVDYATLQAAAPLNRTDLVAPDTGRDSAVRDASGRIVGVRRLRVL